MSAIQKGSLAAYWNDAAEHGRIIACAECMPPVGEKGDISTDFNIESNKMICCSCGHTYEFEAS